MIITFLNNNVIRVNLISVYPSGNKYFVIKYCETVSGSVLRVIMVAQRKLPRLMLFMTVAYFTLAEC